MASLGAHFTDLQLDAAAVGNGTPLSVDQGGGAILVVTGTFVATIVPEVTIDGTNWFSVEAQGLSTGTKVTSITAAGSFIVSAPGAVNVRARISAYTSGTVTVQGRKVVVALILPTGGSGGGAASVVTIKNSAVAGEASVLNAAPAGTEYGLVTRNIPSGTQPISAASLPLPTGAATEATLGNKANEGVPITGQTLEVGGSSVLGWLSSVRKAIMDRLPSALSAGGNLKVTIAEAGIATPVSQSGAPWGVNPTGETAGIGVGAAADLSSSNSVIGRLKALIALLPAALVGGRLDTNAGSWLGATTPTVGQKTMAASLPVAVASDQGNVPVDVRRGLTIAFASIDVAVSGDNTLVAADLSRKIKVLSYVIVADAAVTARWKSGAATNLSGAMSLAVNGGISAPPVAPGAGHWLETAVNQALVLNLGGAVGVRGHLSYILEA